MEKDAKLITVGPTFIPDSRVQRNCIFIEGWTVLTKTIVICRKGVYFIKRYRSVRQQGKEPRCCELQAESSVVDCLPDHFSLQVYPLKSPELFSIDIANLVFFHIKMANIKRFVI